jgi:MoxR-like ATPase
VEVVIFNYADKIHVGTLKFNFSGNNILIRTRINQKSCTIYFQKDGKNIHNSTSQLTEQEQNNGSLRFKQLSWGVQGGTLPEHNNFWYINNKVRINPENTFTTPTLSENRMCIQSLNLTEFTINEENYINNALTEAGAEKLKNAAAIHAKAIVIRCLDWILYNALINNAEIDFDNFRILNIRDRIFPKLFLAKDSTTTEQPKKRITAHELRSKCESKRLYYSYDVYQTIATSMNLGRHLILTGPPGCGKSRLAELVGEMINDTPPKIVTASPSWTSGEIVGRYFPRLGDGKLRFHPGAFLQASEENRCLVIDEMNRANLDECMGELFTVLAGQTVDLPYKDTIDDDEGDDGDDITPKKEKDYGYIKIIPNGSVARDYPENSVYRIGDGFRLIGTMNDSDRSALHNLSFALLRRFDVIGIKSPNANQLIEIINQKTNQIIFPQFQIIITINPNHYATAAKNSLINSLKNIFYPDNGFGLIKERVTGVATLIDSIIFCIEILNPINFNGHAIALGHLNGVFPFHNAAGYVSHLVRSLLSLSLSIKVLPQLDSLDDEKFERALNSIKNGLDSNTPIGPYLFIDERHSNNNVNYLLTPDISIQKISHHFLKIAKHQYKGTMRETIIDNLLAQ